MPVEHWPVRDPGWSRLLNDFLAIEFSKVKLFGHDTQGTKFSRNISVAPTVEDVAGIGPERDDISKRFEFRKRFEDDDIMTLQMAFDCSGQSAKAGANDDDLDAGFRFCLSVGSVVGSHLRFVVIVWWGAKVNL